MKAGVRERIFAVSTGVFAVVLSVSLSTFLNVKTIIKQIALAIFGCCSFASYLVCAVVFIVLPLVVLYCIVESLFKRYISEYTDE